MNCSEANRSISALEERFHELARQCRSQRDTSRGTGELDGADAVVLRLEEEMRDILKEIERIEWALIDEPEEEGSAPGRAASGATGRHPG